MFEGRQDLQVLALPPPIKLTFMLTYFIEDIKKAAFLDYIISIYPAVSQLYCVQGKFGYKEETVLLKRDLWGLIYVR